MAKQVYSFKEGNKDMREILGGKGANLAEMTKLGLPVPQGFTVSTEACLDYYTNKQTHPILVFYHLNLNRALNRDFSLYVY